MRRRVTSEQLIVDRLFHKRWLIFILAEIPHTHKAEFESQQLTLKPESFVEHKAVGGPENRAICVNLNMRLPAMGIILSVVSINSWHLPKLEQRSAKFLFIYLFIFLRSCSSPTPTPSPSPSPGDGASVLACT